MTISAFNDELAQVRTKKKEFLTQIERIVPWKEWLCLIQPCYYKGERGNKPYPLEIMLRLYLLQNLYDLSDEVTVAEAIDSRAFFGFLQHRFQQSGSGRRYPWPFSQSADQERTARAAVRAGSCRAHETRTHSEKGNDSGFHHHFRTIFYQKQ